MTINGRRKGHSFEREIAKILRDTGLFPDAKRHLEYQGEEAKGYDLDHTPPFKIQCKRGKKYSTIKKIEEAVEDCDVNEMPLLITKGDNTRTIACLYLDDFLEIVKPYLGLTIGGDNSKIVAEIVDKLKEIK